MNYHPSLIAQRLMAHVEGTRNERAREHARSQVVERLPFTVRLVQRYADLAKAVGIRQAAYARHLPDFASTLHRPEAADFADGAVVMLAESKLDGSALGSVRIQTNFTHPLELEAAVALPLWLQARRLAEVTRLGVGQGRMGHLVKTALVKGCFEYCEYNEVDWVVVTCRSAVERHYEQLLFTDVFTDNQAIRLPHVGNIEHRVMAFEMATGEARWEAARHRLLPFFRHTRHPDIDVMTRPMYAMSPQGDQTVRRQAVGPTFGLVAA